MVAKYSVVHAMPCLVPSTICGNAVIAEKKNEELDLNFV